MTFILSILHNPYQRNSISGVIDRGFEPLLGQTKDYEIGIGCFSYKHAVSSRNSKDWMARNQDNVFE